MNKSSRVKPNKESDMSTEENENEINIEPYHGLDPFEFFVREAELKKAFAVVGMKVRHDSKIAAAYIQGTLDSDWTVDRVVRAAQEMWWLFNRTEYRQHCKALCDKYSAEFLEQNLGAPQGQAWSVARARGEPEARARALQEVPLPPDGEPIQTGEDPDLELASKLEDAAERSVTLKAKLEEAGLEPRGDSRLCRLFVLNETDVNADAVVQHMREANDLRQNTQYSRIVRSMVKERRREQQNQRLNDGEMREIRKRGKERALHIQQHGPRTGQLNVAGDERGFARRQGGNRGNWGGPQTTMAAAFRNQKGRAASVLARAGSVETVETLPSLAAPPS